MAAIIGAEARLPADQSMDFQILEAHKAVAYRTGVQPPGRPPREKTNW